MDRSSDYNICKEFVELNDNILSAGIIEDMQVVVRYSKPNAPVATGEKLKEMVIQSELFVSMAKTNIDLLGRFRYVAMSFEAADIVPFSLPNGSRNGSSNNKPRLLGIRVARPYDIVELLAKMHIS